MQILVVTHYFPPEIGAPQARLAEMARAWSADGDRVTVLTGLPNHPTGVIPPAYRGVRRCEEQVDGYRVVRTWLYATPNEGVAKKTLGHLSFMATSVLFGSTRVGRPDVVVVSSPTFFSIGSAWVLARIHRARFVVEIRDLWPAIFVELGVLTNRMIIRVLELLELAAYRAADAVVVVSDGFRDNLIGRGVAGTKIETIRNGVDLERFTPEGLDESDTSRSRRELGAGPDETLVLYIGAHGISHGLTTIAEAAAQLRDEPVHVAFVGEGAAKADLVACVDALGLTNVTLHAGVPRDDVARLLAAADICLVPLRDVPLFATFIPSKLFEYLGAGKAVIGSVRGEPAAILGEAGAVVVEPEDVDALTGAIRTLAADPDRRAAMGVRGRSYVEQHFDRRQLARQYRDLLHRVVAGRVATGSAGEPARPSASGSPDEHTGSAPLGAGALSTTVGLARFVWNHPENARRGTTGRVRGVGRLVGWQAWQRAANRPLSITMPGGMRLRCHPHSTAASGVIYCGLPEWEDMRFVLDYLEPGDVFVDVGANVGVFTLLAAATPGVEVRSYEPSAQAFARLTENIERNRLTGRVSPLPVAVGAEAGAVRLTTGLDTVNHVVSEADATAGPDGAGRPPASEAVELVTLDDDVPALDRVALVKIDVEGFEPEVLRGASKLLESRRPAVVVEANDRALLGEILQSFGYRAFAYEPEARQLVERSWDQARGNNLLALGDVDDARRRLAGSA